MISVDLLLVLAAIAAVVFFLGSFIRIVPEYERVIIFRLGRKARALFNPGGDGNGPGLVVLVPFIDKRALGGVTGIIGAGGNVGAVAAGFLMKGMGSIEQTLSILGFFVAASALCAIAVRFSASTAAEHALPPAATV